MRVLVDLQSPPKGPPLPLPHSPARTQTALRNSILKRSLQTYKCKYAPRAPGVRTINARLLSRTRARPPLPRPSSAHTRARTHGTATTHTTDLSSSQSIWFDRIVVHRIVGGVGEGHDRAAVSRADQYADQWPWKSSCLPTLPNMTLATPCVLVLRPKPALYLTSSAISYPSPGFRP